jgi:hypothetical protein
MINLKFSNIYKRFLKTLIGFPVRYFTEIADHAFEKNKVYSFSVQAQLFLFFLFSLRKMISLK